MVTFVWSCLWCCWSGSFVAGWVSPAVAPRLGSKSPLRWRHTPSTTGSPTAKRQWQPTNENDSERNVNEKWDEFPDYDGIGRLFVLPTESNMLRHVTNYLQTRNELAGTDTSTGTDTSRSTDATDASEATDDFSSDANDWVIPKPTIVSFQQFMNDSYETEGVAPTAESEESDDATPFVSSTASRLLESSRARESLINKKAKSLSDMNPIFERYKNGTLSPLSERDDALDTDDDVPEQLQVLPPFSRHHCIGFWRMIQSPTGFVVETDDSVSDNLILRVDGTIAGGPILDQELRHKAAGGHWELVDANTGATDVHTDTVDETETAVLRVALVIPPAKNRMLVMEGTLQQIPHPHPSTTTLQCMGSVWLQDVTDSTRRHAVGTFCMQQLPPHNRPSYTITVPRNVRPGD